LPAAFEPHTEVIAARSCVDRVFRIPRQSALPEDSTPAANEHFLVHSTRECAFHELILSTPRHVWPLPALEMNHLIGLQYCELRVCVDLTVATLYEPDRQRIRSLAAAGGEHLTADELANLLFAGCPKVHGVMWTSTACDPDSTVALFPGRLPPHALALVANPRSIASDADLRTDLHRYASRAGRSIEF
jgi:hypothetical protein